MERKKRIRDEKEANLYRRRRDLERSIDAEKVQSRVRWDLPILAQNKKCSVSLDLPIVNCKPTRACSEVCYACQGRQEFPDALVKSLAVNRMSLEDPERAARRIVDEAAGRPIRLAGSGELLPQHKELVNCIEKYGGSWWGFTRRLDSHKAMPRLMFSIDATTPASVLEYVSEEVPIDRRAYLRRPGDPVAPMEVAVTFPVHGSVTRYTDEVPKDKTDCPSVRKDVEGCWSCQRCY